MFKYRILSLLLLANLVWIFSRAGSNNFRNFDCPRFLSVKNVSEVGIKNTHTLLEWFYSKGICSRIARRFFRSAFINKAIGFIANRYISTFFIKPFIKSYNIDMSEFQDLGFGSFNEFFRRPLKFGARIIDTNPKSIISPADGIMYYISNLNCQTTFMVKGTVFDLDAFLCNYPGVEDFIEGTLVVIYLAPHNYHRFHFPCSSFATTPYRIAGFYESVNPIVYQFGIQPLIENERQVIRLKGYDRKDILMVSVGAMIVGKIALTYSPDRYYHKADEAGYFEFGGSTIVLIFPKNTVRFDQKFKENVACEIKMGERIAEWIDACSDEMKDFIYA